MWSRSRPWASTMCQCAGGLLRRHPSGLRSPQGDPGPGAFEQTGRRQKVVDSKGVTVIEDCYNANPDSMKAALAMFKEFPCKRRFALLGDMLELGDLSREAHEELGRLAAESDLYCLVTYGEQAKRTAVVAAAKGQKTLHANNYREAADACSTASSPVTPAGESQPRHGAGKGTENFLRRAERCQRITFWRKLETEK